MPKVYQISRDQRIGVNHEINECAFSVATLLGVMIKLAIFFHAFAEKMISQFL